MKKPDRKGEAGRLQKTREEERGGSSVAATSGARRERGTARTALDHAENVAALTAWLTGQLIHDGAHDEDAASADAQLGRVEVRDGREVERLAFVVQVDLDAVGADVTLNLHLGVGGALVSVAHDVVGGLVGGEDDGVCSPLIEAGDLTDCLDERPSQPQQAKVAGNGERPGGLFGGRARLRSWGIVDRGRLLSVRQEVGE